MRYSFYLVLISYIRPIGLFLGLYKDIKVVNSRWKSRYIIFIIMFEDYNFILKKLIFNNIKFN